MLKDLVGWIHAVIQPFVLSLWPKLAPSPKISYSWVHQPGVKPGNTVAVVVAFTSCAVNAVNIQGWDHWEPPWRVQDVSLPKELPLCQSFHRTKYIKLHMRHCFKKVDPLWALAVATSHSPSSAKTWILCQLAIHCYACPFLPALGLWILIQIHFTKSSYNHTPEATTDKIQQRVELLPNARKKERFCIWKADFCEKQKQNRRSHVRNVARNM